MFQSRSSTEGRRGGRVHIPRHIFSEFCRQKTYALFQNFLVRRHHVFGNVFGALAEQSGMLIVELLPDTARDGHVFAVPKNPFVLHLCAPHLLFIKHGDAPPSQAGMHRHANFCPTLSLYVQHDFSCFISAQPPKMRVKWIYRRSRVARNPSNHGKRS